MSQSGRRKLVFWRVGLIRGDLDAFVRDRGA